MNAKDIERNRKRLLEMVRRLRGEVADIRDSALRATATHASIANAEAVPGDSGDMSADQLQLDIDISLHENERFILDQVDEALERIKHGTYGRCVECSAVIATERLNAIPYTPYCLDCARRLPGQGAPGVAGGP